MVCVIGLYKVGLNTWSICNVYPLSHLSFESARIWTFNLDITFQYNIIHFLLQSSQPIIYKLFSHFFETIFYFITSSSPSNSLYDVLTKAKETFIHIFVQIQENFSFLHWSSITERDCKCILETFPELKAYANLK